MRLGIFRGPRCRCAPRVGASVAPCPVSLGPQRQFRVPRRDSPPSPRQGAAFGPMPRESRRFEAGWPGTRGGRSTTDRVGKGMAIGLGYPKLGGAVNYSGHWCHTTGGVTSEGGRPLGNAHLFRAGLERSEYNAVVPGSGISEHHESKALGAWPNPLPFLDEDSNQVTSVPPRQSKTPHKAKHTRNTHQSIPQTQKLKPTHENISQNLH